MKQKAGQSAIDYMACVELDDRRAGIEGDKFRYIIIQGLLPNSRQFVVTREGNDINSLRKWLTVVSGTGSQRRHLEYGQRQSKTFRRDARQRSISNGGEGKGATEECVAVADGAQGTIHGALSIIVNFTRRLGPKTFGVCRRKLAQW